MVSIGMTRHQRHCAIMARLPHLEPVYEDDLKQPADQLRTLGRVAAAIGARGEVTSLRTRVQPPWKTPYRAIVVNYDELQALTVP